ncbi:hypothetical protein [Haloprofundus sp. MHR1]|uniref:DUF7287 family protein n=1 Tax=Haloprofundus sp. MHR1 TaxID=2572921 RepID=UPI0010BF53C7|nr:hypothetical protein [Haloprofundus sp. MHR1]QCJ47856.1 hypothetical protein FCF25_12340 [Haloprofundus sp. MHR1]
MDGGGMRFWRGTRRAERQDDSGPTTQRNARAQTTIDFAIGAGVFLLTVAFVVAFIPSMLSPFASGGPENTVVADRVASNLASGLLSTSETPYRVDGECAAVFFGASVMSDFDCGFDPDAATVNERVGISSHVNLHIALNGDRNGDGIERLCWDNTERRVVEADASGCDVRFEAGQPPPTDTGSVVVAWRTVSLAGETGQLEVRVW